MKALTHTVLLTLVLMLLVCGASAQRPSTKSQKPAAKSTTAEERPNPVDRAEAAMAQQDYATAEPLLKEAVSENPKDFRAWYDLGFLYNTIGQKAQSIESYRKSVAANPAVFEPTLNLGLMLAQAQDPEAEKYLRAATQLKPTANVSEGLARAWLSLGHLLQAKDPNSAIAAYSEAAKLQPQDPEPRLSAGLVLERLKQFERAEQEYRAAAAVNPKSTDALIGLTNVYQASGRLPEAEAALRKYLAMEPQNAAAQFQLGRILASQDKRDAAIEAFEAGLKTSPSDLAAMREYASLCEKARSFDKAEAAYRAVLKATPNDAVAHAGLGAVLLRNRKTAEAQNVLLAALKLDPGMGNAYGDLALAASENKNHVLTIRALDERAKYLPENPGTYFLRATAYDHLHDTKRAIENYKQFLAVANGKYPDQEWQAKHRLIAIAPEKQEPR